MRKFTCLSVLSAQLLQVQECKTMSLGKKVFSQSGNSFMKFWRRFKQSNLKRDLVKHQIIMVL